MPPVPCSSPVKSRAGPTESRKPPRRSTRASPTRFSIAGSRPRSNPLFFAIVAVRRKGGHRQLNSSKSPRQVRWENPIMRKSVLAFAAAGVSALTFGALHAQQGGPPPPPPVHDASKVTAGTYKADPFHTQVMYNYNHLGFT